ncbi:MAG: hypothetical protein R3F62_24030 [Planctomycetota bacterium]
MPELDALRDAFLRSRSVENGKDYLAAALAAGEVDPERVQLAAYLGEPAASAQLGGRVPAAPQDLREWLSGLGAYGHETAVRAALSVATRSVGERSLPAAPERALAAARGWILERTEAALRECVDAAQVAFASAYGEGEGQDQIRELVHDTAVSVDGTALACCYAAQAACEPTAERAAAIASLTAFTSSDQDDAQLRAWVREDLTRWALGLEDPLRA